MDIALNKDFEIIKKASSTVLCNELSRCVYEGYKKSSKRNYKVTDKMISIFKFLYKVRIATKDQINRYLTLNGYTNVSEDFLNILNMKYGTLSYIDCKSDKTTRVYAPAVGMLYILDKYTSLEINENTDEYVFQQNINNSFINKEQSEILKGIVNGIDYEEFNPEEDKFIFKNFNCNNIKDKIENKLSLQKELGLPQKEDTPMIGLISRLTHQKGCDLIVSIIDRLLQKDIQFVVLGTGDYWYEETFKNLQYRYPDKVLANIKFDNVLAHKIYAGTDMFLMPSLFEPCGLGQLISLRYGAIPIVRETGGLKDTISPYNEYTGEGNGFGFKNFNSNELMQITEYALKIYKDKDAWKNIIRQAMNSDNSWDKSAIQYKKLYEGLVKTP